MKPRFRAEYRRNRNGWAVAVDELPKVNAFGRTLDSARIDLVDQLAERFKAYRGALTIEDSIDLPSSAEKALTKARKARNDALQAAALSHSATIEAALKLTKAGLSLRDVGYLLGLSHGRVQQLLDSVNERRSNPGVTKNRTGGKK